MYRVTQQVLDFKETFTNLLALRFRDFFAKFLSKTCWDTWYKLHICGHTRHKSNGKGGIFLS